MFAKFLGVAGLQARLGVIKEEIEKATQQGYELHESKLKSMQRIETDLNVIDEVLLELERLS